MDSLEPTDPHPDPDSLGRVLLQAPLIVGVTLALLALALRFPGAVPGTVAVYAVYEVVRAHRRRPK